MLGAGLRSSGDPPPRRGLTDGGAVALAVSVWVGAALHRPAPLWLGCAGILVALAGRRPVLLWVGAAVLASALGARAVAGLTPPPPRPVLADVTLVGDPEEAFGATRVDVRLDGRRYEAWARGRAGAELSDALAGEVVSVAGRARPSPDTPWLAARHVVGRLDVDEVERRRPGGAVWRWANGLRRTMARGAEPLPETTRALFTGFVLGDDRDISPVVVDDFRGSGLSHLLAVSGQNVAFVLALAAPVVRRFPLAARFAATVGLLAFFALLTRFEPSVLRATAMAAIAVIASTIGREASSVRLLALAVAGLLLVDPLLVRSVGFRLSVAASAGIVMLSPWLAERIPGPAWLRLPLAVTVGAQLAVSPLLVTAFGGVPVVSVAANLLAAPAAAPITLWGLTAGIVAGVVPEGVAVVLHLPTRLLLGWVAWVARLASGLPMGEWGAAHLAALGVAVGLLWRGRAGWALLLTVSMAVTPAVALRTAPSVQEVADGIQVRRSGADAVLVLTGDVTTADVLEAMRRAGVRRPEAVVVVEGVAIPIDLGDALRARAGRPVLITRSPCSVAACSPSGPTASTSPPVPS